MSAHGVPRRAWHAAVAVLACALGACTTHIRRYQVSDNPLDAIEAAADESDEWYAHRVDEDTLELRDYKTKRLAG